jgi:hypothetical protein
MFGSDRTGRKSAPVASLVSPGQPVLAHIFHCLPHANLCGGEAPQICSQDVECAIPAKMNSRLPETVLLVQGELSDASAGRANGKPGQLPNYEGGLMQSW